MKPDPFGNLALHILAQVLLRALSLRRAFGAPHPAIDAFGALAVALACVVNLGRRLWPTVPAGVLEPPGDSKDSAASFEAEEDEARLQEHFCLYLRRRPRPWRR